MTQAILDPQERAYIAARETKAVRKPDSATVLRVIADYFRVTVDEVKAHYPAGVMKTAHGVAVYLHRELLGMTLTETARAFSRDHQTIMSTLNRFQRDLRRDPVLQRWIESLVSLIAEAAQAGGGER